MGSAKGFTATHLVCTIPAMVVRRLPGRLRDHHGRADLGRDRRPHQVRHLDGLRRASGPPSSTSRWRTGCSPSTAHSPHTVGWIAEQAARDRLRRRHGGAHQRRRRRPRARARARQAGRLQEATRCDRTTCRWSCWARACCGSAGSASTPARRSPPTAGGRVWVNTHGRHRAAILGWLLVERLRDGHATSLGAASGAVAGLVAITPSCSALSPDRARSPRPDRRCRVCALAVGLKYRFGLRRLARRRRRAPGRRPRRHPVGVGFLGDRAPRPAGVDGLFYGGGLDQLLAAGGRRRARCWRTRSW